ncbi:hypothetical protein PR202_ga17118 [Eleusine coracana subsp. coracana]|uniref:SCP domain-containing protein n=1 Tax=Eleusine coracana subsp. coracana TaxID=191504 RepID=A0AAV5CNA8_ELECO|nr:hypothetical protein PR202_ga17118 [Eleusine coracana subsp. coracana]
MAFSKGLMIAFAMATIATIASIVSAQNTAQDFVDLHNEARAAVGVGPVTWDPVVAQYAQSYAEIRANDCGLVLSGGPYGENLFWGSWGRVWTASDAVGLWVSQKVDYNYTTDTCPVLTIGIQSTDICMAKYPCFHTMLIVPHGQSLQESDRESSSRYKKNMDELLAALPVEAGANCPIQHT